ncbi:cation:proton antiporter [Microbacterium invictum]|uniref:CPA1 family monovalent cation:H+ antiporter n=1 Tax=Microbacterium invictum TaxID=515415 RepID=A0AA40SQ63_9MICO|nr:MULTISPECIES: sodium:proton antiporter [Microbacterium]MBB4140368.1 CPA1 family monovalent cation:H+ antiporter [Microbacterium invictum]
MEPLTAFVIGVIVIAVSTVLARRLGIAAPLILVAIGLLASLFLPPIEVDPELILVGILPPLLYSAAVRMPALEFRRDALPITGLAVLLVVISALLLGALFFVAVPGLGFPLAVAMGAILSPTDAVATSIVKKLGVSPRVVTMLEGESLLNDATALVLLRSAVAAVAAGFSFWGTVGAFAWGVLAAVVVGVFIGLINLRVRRWITDPGANTALGFVVPFIAYFPTEHLGGSGLVAAVAAGITTGQGATRWFTPEQRLSDEHNWRTVELLLEGAVFLIMGLELRDLVTANLEEHNGVGTALALAAASLGIVLAVRAVYVSVLVLWQGRRARTHQRERLHLISDRLDQLDEVALPGRARSRVAGMRSRLTRGFNDLDYYQASALGWKHGTVIVWAGMRGVVTLAAAQTLPASTPSRELVVFTAFLVALLSLLGQGLTLPALIRWLRIPASIDPIAGRAEQEQLDDELHAAALEALRPGLTDAHGVPFPAELLETVSERLAQPPREDPAVTTRAVIDLRIALIEVMRRHLTELAKEGGYSSATVRVVLAQLDADQLSLEVRRGEE